jgi:hypothetical protein
VIRHTEDDQHTAFALVEGAPNIAGSAEGAPLRIAVCNYPVNLCFQGGESPPFRNRLWLCRLPIYPLMTRGRSIWWCGQIDLGFW